MSPSSEPPWRTDQGAALVTVLVMLVVMAVLATAVLEAARFSVARLDNQRQMEQARWYLLGAERFAADRATLALAAMEARGASADWQGQTTTFPIEGGAISVTLWDGSNCFNLNSIVIGNDEGYTAANPAAQMEFVRILGHTRAQVFSPEGLAAALADYLDADSVPTPGGAEDSPVGGEGGYRTANTLMGDVSELLQVRGFTPEIVAALAPYVCVRPRPSESIININSLRREDAALLSAVFGEGLSLSAAQGLIASRPVGGWRDVDAFFSDPRLNGFEISDGLKARFAVRPRFVIMTARVRWEGLEEASAALIEIGPPSRIVRRVYGAQAAERSV